MGDDERQDQENEWRLSWPPSPRTQVILIAIGLGLFNLLLILIWAVAVYYSR